MKITFRTLTIITKVSMAINVCIFLYLTVSYLPPAPTYGKLDLFEKSARLFVIGDSNDETNHYRKTNSNINHENTCHKSIVLFGIRKFWFTFCSYEEFAQYKYLTLFPRTFYCPTINCSVTINHTRDPSHIREYDIVLFTDVDQWITDQMWDWIHGNRTVGQRWVMVTEESPYYSPGIQPPEKYSAVTYDWVGSYSQDADFHQPYGYYKPFREGHPPVRLDREKILNKTGLTIWLGSHCKTLQWDRLRFVEDLGKFMSLKKMGRCGDEIIPWNREEVLKQTLSPFRFYLSLENSCCKHYITEKFWRTLQFGLVPIVVGAPLEDYEKLAPPNSFIHPDQFDSMVAMATHILEVATDKERYLEYFQWKTKGEIVVYTQEEYYVHPLTNSSNCDIVQKYLNSKPSDHSKLDYFGPKWFGSCTECSTKKWLNDKYTHRKNYSILPGKLWD